MSIIVYYMKFQVVLVEKPSQNIKIFIRYHCIFRSSENIRFEWQLSNVMKSILWGNLSTVKLHISFFAIIILSERSMSVSLNPMFNTVNWSSSRLMCCQYTKSFTIKVVFLSLSAQKGNKTYHEVDVKLKVMDQNP